MIFPFNQHSPQIAASAYVADNASIIGEVTLAERVSIWFGAVLRGDMSAINIGEETNIQDNCVLHVDEDRPLIIARRVLVGHGVILHGCEIGESSMIGIGAVILNGAKIGKNCVIGARALVGEGKVIPDNSVVFGIPGKIIKTVTPDNTARIQAGVDHYLRLSQQYKKARH